MITKLKIQNLKQTRDETLALQQHNILLGPWGSGKTTVLDALQVGTQGKLSNDLYRGAGLAPLVDALTTGGESSMSVGIESDNLSFTRTYERNGKYTQKIDIPSKNMSGVNKCAPFVDNVFGNAIFDVRVLRDDPDTVKNILLGHCKLDSEKYNGKTLSMSILRGVTNALLGESWYEHAAEFIGSGAELVAKAKDKLNEAGVAWDSIMSKPYWKNDGLDFFRHVGSVIECIAEDRKEMARRVQDEKKTIRSFQDDVVNFNAPTTKIQTLRAEVEQQEAELSKYNRMLGEHESAARRIKEIESELVKSKAVSAGRGIDAVDTEIEKAEAYCTRLKTEYEREYTIAHIEESIAAEQKWLDDNRDKFGESNTVCLNCDIESHGTLLGLIDTIKPHVCNSCKDIIETSIVDTLQTLKQKLAEAKDTVDYLWAETIKQKLEAITGERDVLVDQRKSTPQSLAWYKDELQAAKEDLKTLHKTKEAIQTTSRLIAELEKIQPPDVENIQALINGLTESVSTKRAELEKQVEAKTRKSAYNEHQYKLKQAELYLKAYQAMESGAKAFNAVMVTDTFGAMCADVNEGLRDVAAEWSFYIELDDKGRIDFGVEKPIPGGGFSKTPYRSLSGAESVLTRNVMGAVLLKYSGTPEKILIDEIAEMPVNLVPEFLNAIKHISGPDIQCVFATCHDVNVPAEWNVINRG